MLYRSKLKGGLNFRELSTVNDALLAKQYWRLIDNNGSMVSRTLKAKYLCNSDITQAQLGSRPSFTWRSIWTARAKVREWIDLTHYQRPVWTAEGDGSFSTKSAYMKIREQVENAEVNRIGECSNPKLITSFWIAI